MEIVPTQLEPPWPYAASKVLNPLRHPVTGPEFIARVRRFSRVGVLTLGTRFLWYTWNHDETVKATTTEAIGHRVTMAYAERVMMLAAIFGSDYNRPDPSEVEFRLLCWELHNASDGAIVALSSAEELASRLTRIDSDSPLRRVTREHARTLLVEAYKARIAALQHVGRYFDRSQYARGYLIARALAARASTLGGAEYTRAEKQYLLSSVEGYFRCAWALFFKAWTGLAIPREAGQPPVTDYGHVYAKDWPEDPNLEKVDLTVERMRAVASVLSEPLSSFAAHRTRYQNADAAVLKYDASLDRLLIRPMIDVEHGGRCEHVAIPSPWRYVHAVPEIVLYDFVRYLQERRATVLAGQDAYSIRGQAFADYVREVVGRTSGLVDLDHVQELSGHERPDFLCIGTEHTVLVELKFSLKPNEDRILKDTSAAVEAWRRAAEAIAQTSGLLREHGALLRQRYGIRGPVVLAIVSNDLFPDESIGFTAVAKAGELLVDTGIDAVVTLNVDELERWLLLGSIDELARQARESWAKLDPTSLNQDRRIQAPKPEGVLPHIEAAWKALFHFYDVKKKQT